MTAAKRTTSIYANAASNWAALLTHVLMALVLTPFIISHIGKAGYGIWSLILAIIGYYGILRMGVDSAVMRYVARQSALGDYHAASVTTSTSMALFLAIGSALVAATVVFAAPLAEFFEVEPRFTAVFGQVILVLAIGTLITLLTSVLAAILRARELFVPLNAAMIATHLLQGALTVILLNNDMGLLGVAYAHLGAALARFGICLWLWRRRLPDIMIHPALIQRSVAGTLLVFGGISTMIVVGDRLRFSLDSFVIAKKVSAEAVAVYAIAGNIMNHVVSLIGTASGVLTPRFASIDARGDHVEMRRLYMKALSVTAPLAFGICCLAFVLGGQFINIWVGRGFLESMPVLWVLAAGYAFALAQNPTLGLLYATNKHRIFAWQNLCEGLANLVLSLILVRHYGIVGVALGTAIPMLTIKLVVQPIYTARILRMNYGRFILPLAPSVLAFALVAFAGDKIGLMSMWETTSIWVSGLVAAGTAVVFLLILLPTSLLIRVPLPAMPKLRFGRIRRGD